MMVLFFIITGLYVILIAAFSYGFNKVKNFTCIESHPKTRFSIVIAFRNEAENLPKLLNSLSQLKYPLDYFEIILLMMLQKMVRHN